MCFVYLQVFVDGLQKYFQLGPSLERMFPRLADLTELHLGLLSRLRQRQRESPVVSTIADILLEQFSDHHASKLKSAYGEDISMLFIHMLYIIYAIYIYAVEVVIYICLVILFFALKLLGIRTFYVMGL